MAKFKSTWNSDSLMENGKPLINIAFRDKAEFSHDCTDKQQRIEDQL